MLKKAYLSDGFAETLYEKYAKELPVIDYHNHLSVTDIAKDRRFTDIYDLWIAPDPYKHRAMRMCGVAEKYVTGDASAEEKFSAWCAVFPRLIANPLYAWSLSELSDVFGVEEKPSSDNAARLYKTLNRFLAENDVTPSFFIKKYKVEKLCPCLSLADEIPDMPRGGAVVPSLRADDGVCPDEGAVKRLSALTGKALTDLEGYLDACLSRIREFYARGCRFADHALDSGFAYHGDDGANARRFSEVLSGAASATDRARLRDFLLCRFFSEYARLGMAVQLHVGALRSTSTRLRTLAGPAGGYAACGDGADAASLARLLDDVEKTASRIPKTVIFPLDPADNAKLSTLSGSFSADGVSGLVTLGPAWWWNDHRSGILAALRDYSGTGLLSNFIGMTTDSRSFLSLSRHDMFRRVLCGFLARLRAENALFAEEDELGDLIRKMCYENASAVFGKE